MSEVQKLSGTDRQQAAMMLSALEHLMADEAIALNPIEFEGLGAFISSKHPEYIQEDSHTGAVVLYPPRYSYRFQSFVEIENDDQH